MIHSWYIMILYIYIDRCIPSPLPIVHGLVLCHIYSVVPRPFLSLAWCSSSDSWTMSSPEFTRKTCIKYYKRCVKSNLDSTASSKLIKHLEPYLCRFATLFVVSLVTWAAGCYFHFNVHFRWEALPFVEMMYKDKDMIAAAAEDPQESYEQPEMRHARTAVALQSECHNKV